MKLAGSGVGVGKGVPVAPNGGTKFGKGVEAGRMGKTEQAHSKASVSKQKFVSVE